MAGEISMTTSGTYVKGSAKLIVSQLVQTINQATQGYTNKVLTIPTSDTVISLSEISTLGVAVIQNLDTTNYCDVGPTVSSAIAPLVRLLPGERWPFRLTPGITLRAQAHTAACKIAVTVFEN